ncbi:MAG: isopentenyl phosphate kinase [Anaerolineales bacterium]|nr:isopentenyl phosphate kinase [Anaerolineales bacterium]
MMKLTFLKLGGSLITDKTRPYTPRLDKLAELAAQIAAATHLDPRLHLVLGHGSGSFGHAAASQNWPVNSKWEAEDWRGFAEVWYQASALNRLVMDALHNANIPAISFPPSAASQAKAGIIEDWYIKPLKNALEAGILPVIFGDVAFDATLNGTILSTEDLFFTLANHLHPQRILLAGLEKGVWADFPARSKLVNLITPENFGSFSAGMVGAAGMDVTGGMRDKVEQMLRLVEQVAGLEVSIFSGEAPDAIKNALLGMNTGTLLRC